MRVGSGVPLWVVALLLAPTALIIAVQSVRLARERAAHAETREVLAKVRAEHTAEKWAAERERVEQLIEIRRLENRRWHVAQETAREHMEQVAQLERAVARHRGDVEQLQHAIAAYAAGAGESAADPGPTCEARAAALGDVLGESLRLQVELAGAAERHLADARSLYAERASLSDAVSEEGAP